MRAAGHARFASRGLQRPMSENESHQRLRLAVEQIIESELRDHGDDEVAVPIVTDFSLIVAIEDASREDSPVYFRMASSRTGGYRLRGLHLEGADHFSVDHWRADE